MAISGGGGFLSGFMSVVGPRIEEKHAALQKLKAEKKEAEFSAYWSAAQSASKRLDELKTKERQGTLTDAEADEAQTLATKLKQWDAQVDKMSKGDKPLSEAVRKVQGIVKGVLGRSGGKSQDQQQAQPSPNGKLQPPGAAQPAQASAQQTPQPGAQSGPLQPPPQSAPQQNGAASGPLQPPPPREQSQGQAPTQTVGAQSGPLKPPPQRQRVPELTPLQSAMATNAEQPQREQQASFQEKQKEEEAEYSTWLDRGKKVLGADANPRDLAEYAGSKGQRLPAQGRVLKDVGVQRPGYEGSWIHEVSADGKEESWTQQAAKPHNSRKVWLNYPDGTLHAADEDPQNPGKRIDADTGQPVPEGASEVNMGQLTAKARQDSYGAFGNYYRAERGKGKSEEEARKTAGEMVEREYGVKLARQQQQIAIDAALSGIGGGSGVGGSAGGGGKSTTTTGGGTSGGSKSKGATEGQPGKLTDAQRQDIDVYLGSLLGTMKGGSKAAQVRQQRGQEALAKLTGLNPIALNAELAGDKAIAGALAEAVKVSGAFGRVQETLKQHGQVLLDAAKAYGPGGVPIANRTIQWLQSNAEAHPELTKYTLALNAVQREYARLVSGGVQSRAMLPVSSQEKGETVLRKDATMADVVAAVQQLQVEANTEQKAFGDQIEGLKQKLGGGKIGQALNPSPNGKLTAPSSGPKTGDTKDYNGAKYKFDGTQWVKQ